MSIKPLFMPTILTLVACESIDDVTPLETDPAVASDADAPAASLESVEVEIAVDASALLRARDGREVAAPRVAVFADDGAEALPDDLAAASCDSCEQGPDSWSCFGCSPYHRILRRQKRPQRGRDGARARPLSRESAPPVHARDVGGGADQHQFCVQSP